MVTLIRHTARGEGQSTDVGRLYLSCLVFKIGQRHVGDKLPSVACTIAGGVARPRTDLDSVHKRLPVQAPEFASKPFKCSPPLDVLEAFSSFVLITIYTALCSRWIKVRRRLRFPDSENKGCIDIVRDTHDIVKLRVHAFPWQPIGSSPWSIVPSCETSLHSQNQ